jgi:hypothetical protein
MTALAPRLAAALTTTTPHATIARTLAVPLRVVQAAARWVETHPGRAST